MVEINYMKTLFTLCILHLEFVVEESFMILKKLQGFGIKNSIKFSPYRVSPTPTATILSIIIRVFALIFKEKLQIILLKICKLCFQFWIVTY